MPNIRVTCPACKSELEIDSAHEGQEIECGGCLQVFAARANKPARDDRKRRRRDEDEDEEDYYPPPERSRKEPNGLAITSLVLGIVSVALVLIMFPMACIGGCCCPPLAWLPLPITIPTGLGAIITGAIGVRRTDGKAMAIIGIILGALALCLAVLQLTFGFLPFLAAPPAPVR